MPPPPPLPRPSSSAAISSRLHHSPLSHLASSTDRSSPLSLPPPLSSRRVVPHPRLSRLRRRSEGTAALLHPSPSRRRRGKIPSIVVARPPSLFAPSNICSRSHQRDNIAAPVIVAAARQTSILAKNAATALLLARGTSFPTAAVTDAVPPHPKALPHAPPQQHVDCHFPFKAWCRCPPAPATPHPLTDAGHRSHTPTIPMVSSPSLRWLRWPRRAGVVTIRGSPSSHWRLSRWRHPPRSSGERVSFSPVCLVKKNWVLHHSSSQETIFLFRPL
jgi:hypothetical protein